MLQPYWTRSQEIIEGYYQLGLGCAPPFVHCAMGDQGSLCRYPKEQALVAVDVRACRRSNFAESRLFS